MGLRLEGRGLARPRSLTLWNPRRSRRHAKPRWLLHDEIRAVLCSAGSTASRVDGGWRAHAPAFPRLSPGVCGRRRRGGAERRAVGALDKRWVTTRRSSLGDFGHSRLALRREGSDRHRGCYPTDPTGEGCPSFRRDRSSVPSGGVPSSRGQLFHPAPARRVAPVCRRGRKPTSRKAGEDSPPTYAPRHPQRVHGGTPFSVAP